MNFNILRFDMLDSTNTEAADQARRGAAEGLCVVARQQTSGRGRHGRTWISEKDAGLYFSVVLRPRLDPRDLPLLTLMAGVAVHDTLADLGMKPDIKWVNDVLVGEKKISGILAETVETPAGLAIVVGIGINLASRDFPDEIADAATSIEAETAGRVAPDELAALLTHYLSDFYAILNGEDGPAEILEHWHRRSTYFTGKSVRVTLADSVIEGITDGLEDNGALRVKTGDGSLQIVYAGDVQNLRPSVKKTGSSALFDLS
jgi:BirA family biotin operon repressor/biotin-[acetyl-CoA-carboxylase] ligase